MKPQTPAQGIMLNRNWGTACSYTIACECGSRDHSANMWIEVGDESDADLQNVTVTFYVETASPWYSLNRWQEIVSSCLFQQSPIRYQFYVAPFPI